MSAVLARLSPLVLLARHQPRRARGHGLVGKQRLAAIDAGPHPERRGWLMWPAGALVSKVQTCLDVLDPAGKGEVDPGYDTRNPCAREVDGSIFVLDIRSDPPVAAGPATWDGHPKVPIP